MPIPYSPLSDSQKEFIRTNFRRMSFKEMARLQHTSVERVREFMITENLPYRKPNMKAEGRRRKSIIPEGYFNYQQYGNWLIG